MACGGSRGTRTDQRAGLAGHRTPAEEALVNGHPELAAQLVAFAAAALAGDAGEVSRTDTAVIAAVRETRPGLVTWAASQGAPNAVELLVSSGFDVNSFGRSDVPADDPWHTALHVAAETASWNWPRSSLNSEQTPHLHDRHSDSTPLDWARRSGHQPLIDLLNRY